MSEVAEFSSLCRFTGVFPLGEREEDCGEMWLGTWLGWVVEGWVKAEEKKGRPDRGRLRRLRIMLGDVLCG